METNKIITGYPFVDHVDQDYRPELSIDFLDKAYTRFYTDRKSVV